MIDFSDPLRMIISRKDSIYYCWYSCFHVIQHSPYRFKKVELDYILYQLERFHDATMFGEQFFIDYSPNLKKVVRNSKKYYVQRIFNEIQRLMKSDKHAFLLSFSYDYKLNRSTIKNITIV